MTHQWTVDQLEKTKRGDGLWQYECWVPVEGVSIHVGPDEDGELVARIADAIEDIERKLTVTRGDGRDR